MKHVIVVIDFEDDGQLAEHSDKLREHSASENFDLHFCQNLEEAEIQLDSPDCIGILLRCIEFTPEVDQLLRGYTTRVGCLPEFVAVMCDDPSPRFIASIYEFGVDKIYTAENILDEGIQWLLATKELLEDETSPQFHALALSKAVKMQNQDAIAQTVANMKELADQDFKAAYLAGKASEIQGNFAGAEENFRLAAGINKMYRPSLSSLAETLLVNGKAEEAITVLQKLEKSNSRDMLRKSNLVAAYLEVGDQEKAKQVLEEAKKIDPNHTKVKEAAAHVLVAEGKVGDAFTIMDELKDAGPLFASKLNVLGIRLSKAGKAKSALALYNKAHKIVREDIKYKVTLNAALCCRRSGQYETAMKYLARCKKEYGGMFPKLERIWQTTKEAIDKSQVDKAG